MLRRFSVQLTVRVLVIVLLSIALAFVFADEQLFFNQIILGLLLIAMTINLISYVHHTHRDIAKFLEAINQSDFTITFNQKQLGSSQRALYDSFEIILSAYKDLKIEKEAQYQFLNLLVENIHIGIISVDTNGKILLINRIAKQILAVQHVINWATIEKKNSAFAEKVMEMGNSANRLIEIASANGIARLAVEVSSTKLIDKEIKLITFKDIENVIDQKEIEAWHKLIRILTHEIMNSLTPVSSLTETMQAMLESSEGSQISLGELTDEKIKDLRFSLQTLRRRSDGMLHFVEDYRKVTKVPLPALELVSCRDLLEDIKKLLFPDMERDNIKLKLEVQDFNLSIDRGQVDQALINLIKNSRHALVNRENPTIFLKSYMDKKGKYLSVEDNGTGIETKLLKEVFVPFFTTRDKGSGIGLSLTKQIMSLHNGRINIDSSPGSGTIVTLTFPGV